MGAIVGKGAPTPPDPVKTAGAQTATNIGTAVANAFLTNPTQQNARGSVSYDETGTRDWYDPTTKKTYQIPLFTQTETLTPTLAEAERQNQATQRNLATIGNDQSARVGDLLSTEFSLAGAPGKANRAGQAAAFAADPANQVARSYGDPADYADQRQRVESALMDRMQPHLTQDRRALEQSMADRGMTVGTEGYSLAMDEMGRRTNDARMSAILAGGEEQNRLAGLDQQRAAFGNQALQQAYGMNAARADARAADRSDYINEEQLTRNQPINEISALLGGSQVQAPRFTPANTPQMATVDYAGLVNSNYAQQMAAHNAKMQLQTELLKGAMGVGGAALTGGYL